MVTTATTSHSLSMQRLLAWHTRLPAERRSHANAAHAWVDERPRWRGMRPPCVKIWKKRAGENQKCDWSGAERAKKTPYVEENPPAKGL